MEAIQKLTQEKTVIMIAHRLKTVRHADQILVVDKGQIVQRGTHDELMKQDGIYRHFISGREQAVDGNCLIYSDLQNRIADGFIHRFRTQFCVLRGLGQCPNKHETGGFRSHGIRLFSQSGYRFALFAGFLLPFVAFSNARDFI